MTSKQKISLLEGGPLGKRPQMPGSTKAPGISGQATPYSTKMPAKLFSQTAGAKMQNGSITEVDLQKAEDAEVLKKQNAAMNKIDTHVTKMVARLPMNIREPVTSILQLAFDMSHNAQQKVDTQQGEVIVLRSDVKKKSKQLEQLNNTCDIYRDRLKILEEKLRSLQDDLKSRAMITTQNKRALNRMSGTNRMLINSLEALNVEIGDQKEDDDDDDDSRDDNHGGHRRASSPSGLKTNNSITSISEILSSVPGVENTKPLGDNHANSKLRDSLLRISREHYTYVKKTETLEKTLLELRKELVEAEARSRRFKIELDEFKDPSVHEDGVDIEEQRRKINAGVSSRALKMNIADIDDLFKFQVFHRNAIEPVEAVVFMRRLISLVSAVPTTSEESILAHYLISEHTAKIFQVEGMVLSVALDDGGGLTKYVSRDMPPVIHADVTKSITTEVMRTGTPIRLNQTQLNMSNVFNNDVDSCPNVVSKAIIGVPIVDRARDETVGALLFINKRDDQMFTQVDEIFAFIFSEMVGTWFTAVLVNKRLQDRAETLTHLMHAPMDLLKVIPEENTIAASRTMSPKELLYCLQTVAKDCMKASRVRAFLLDKSTNELLFLDPRSSDPSENFEASEIRRVSPKSGIAGHCIQVKRLHVFSDSFDDVFYNPEIDIDPIGVVSVCVPLMDPQAKEVMGAIQIVASSASPTMSAEHGNDGQILFDQGCEWFTYQISAQLTWLYTKIGFVAPTRPALTPKRRFSTKLAHSFNSLNVDEESDDNRSVSSRGSSRRGRRELIGAAVTPVGSMKRVTIVSGRSVLRTVTPKLTGQAELEVLRSKVASLTKQLNGEEATPVGDGGTNAISSLDRDGGDSSRFSFTKEQVDDLEEQLSQWKTKFDMLESSSTELTKERDDAISRQVTLQDQLAIIEKELSDKTLFATELKASAGADVERAVQAQQIAEASVLELQVALGTAEAKANAATREAAAYKTASEATGDATTAEQALRTSLEQRSFELEKKIMELTQEKEKIVADAASAATTAAVKDSELVSLNARYEEARGGYTSATAQVAALSAQVQALQESLVQKDSVMNILQQQVVKMANDSVSKIDDAVLRAAEASREAEVAALAKAAADADAAAAAAVAGSGGGGESGNPMSPSGASISTAASGAWSQYTDDNGNFYYHNSITNETAWELPSGVVANNSVNQTSTAVDSSATAPGARIGDWVQYFDDAGHPFWVNEKTGESSWEAPNSDGSIAGGGGGGGDGGYNIEL